MTIQDQPGSGAHEEFFHTIIVGGGQAGLAAGYFLAKQGRSFVILDQHARSGDAWRCRWDSLRLFTPSQFDGLPGMPFPLPKNTFPTREMVADYLEDYARANNLPLRHNLKVENLCRAQDGYHLTAAASRMRAQNVIVATGPFQTAYIPAFGSQLRPDILQLHSSEYHNPAQVTNQSVLVVGAGNSGCEIALELARAGRQVWLSGRDVGRLPSNSPLGSLFEGRLLWWFISHILTLDTPIGRKMRAGAEWQGTPLGRLRREELPAAGVQLVPRASAVQAGQPQSEDGRALRVDAVIWATGFKPDYRWIDLPIFDPQGYPLHERGSVPGAPGLYFLGLPFQSGLSSPLLGGVGKDAARITAKILQPKGKINR